MTVNISMLRPHLRGVPPVRPLPEGYTLRPLGHADEPDLARLLSLAFAEEWDEVRVQTELTRAEEVRAVYGIFAGTALVATASSQTRPDRDPHAGLLDRRPSRTPGQGPRGSTLKPGPSRLS